ncbi:MAG: nickel/cobalt transporter [Alphaproteobacteria bacterium]|nr:nickel/cobalt transporter [Alphaproteobacteria bacterium]
MAGAIWVLMLVDGGGGFWSNVALDIQAAQRDLHRQLAAAMEAVQRQGATAAGALVVLSFLYGVFHAAGPGHGKVVISTYLMTQESQLRRGVVLSMLAALTQGLTAILVVEAMVGVLGLTFRLTKTTAASLELISYGFVALVGGLLVLTRARRLLASPIFVQPETAGQIEHSHKPGGSCSDCGHGHGPSLTDMDVPISPRTLFGVILSVGIRPCSGAVIVLIAAHAMELKWAGWGAVLAMSIGTGFTVSSLAVLSVHGRKMALRLVTMFPSRAPIAGAVIDFVGLAGGTAILLVGALLFHAAWSAPFHPLG